MPTRSEAAARWLVDTGSRSPLDLYVPTPRQELFHRDQHPRRRLQAANGGGKTVAGAAEAWWHLTRRHPWRPVLSSVTTGLIVSADWTSYRDVVAKTMAALAPWDELDPSCDYTPARGWRNGMIRMKNGNSALFRSAESESTSVAGITASWAWADEPLPEHLWGEVRGRLRGQWVPGSPPPMWLTYTPIGRPLEYLRLHVEGDPTRGIPPREDWSLHQIRLTEDDCPHLAPRTIAAMLQSYRADEYAQRVLGEWDGPTFDRVLDGWTSDAISSEMPEADWEVGLGIDHGERAGAESVVLLAWQTGRPVIWVLDEWESTRGTEPAEDAREIRAMLLRRGLQVSDLAMVVGDTNSAGKQAVGRRINDLLSQELGVPIRPPNKRPGSVDYGCRLLNMALRRGHLRVHPRCKGQVQSIQHWRGKDDDLKHRIDRLRYIAVPVLEATYSRRDLDLAARA